MKEEDMKESIILNDASNKHHEESIRHIRSLQPTPTLIRTSKLSKNINLNSRFIPESVVLTTKSDIMSMALNWTKNEIQNQRRLVKFNFVKKSISHFEIEFHAISNKDYSLDLPIISCIYWKEQGIHIVTSVDIVLILEYLIQQSFSIEEKNRIRRNLQSLKPYTISRTGPKNARFFNLLMNMEDPRPRNIEKDLKVFHWSDILLAIEKVVSKYSPNLLQKESGFIMGGKPYDEPSHHDNDLYERGIAPEVKVDETALLSGSSFMPKERLKVLKRKLTKSNNLHQIGKHRIFQHALTPADPIPLKSETNKNKWSPEFKKRRKDVDEDIGQAFDIRKTTVKQEIYAQRNTSHSPNSQHFNQNISSLLGQGDSVFSMNCSLSEESTSRNTEYSESEIRKPKAVNAKESNVSTLQYYPFSNQNRMTEYPLVNAVSNSLNNIVPRTSMVHLSMMNSNMSALPLLQIQIYPHLPPQHQEQYQPNHCIQPNLSNHTNITATSKSSIEYPRRQRPFNSIPLATKHPIYKAPGLYCLPQATNSRTIPRQKSPSGLQNLVIPQIRQKAMPDNSDKDPKSPKQN